MGLILKHATNGAVVSASLGAPAKFSSGSVTERRYASSRHRKTARFGRLYRMFPITGGLTSAVWAKGSKAVPSSARVAGSRRLIVPPRIGVPRNTLGRP